MSLSVIFPRVRFVLPTTGQSVSGIFLEGLHLWIVFGPPTYCCTFTIFSWKLGTMAVSDNTFNLEITQFGLPSSAKLLLGGATIEYWWCICGDLMLIMWVKTISVNLSFLRWFGLMNDAYVHRYTHWWDRGLHLQSRVNLPVLWAQLSIYVINKSRCGLFIGFLLSELE